MSESADWKEPDGLDPECRDLCAALNEIPGLETVESCCGHDQWGFYVIFDADQDALDRLAKVIPDFEKWHLTTRSRWHCLLGPVGEEAYAQAAELAGKIGSFDALVPDERSVSAYPSWARAVSAEAGRNLEAVVRTDA